MEDGGHGTHIPQADAELLLQFAPKARDPRFTGFALAPWKFPIAAKVRSLRPLANEVLAPTLNERERDLDSLDGLSSH